jgi:hypothetical protein
MKAAAQAEAALQGKWITSPEFARLKPVNVFHRAMEPMAERKSGIENRHILFRKKFVLGEKGPALLRVSADDYYKLYINGSFVTQGPCPGYHFHYYYNTVDVSPFLRPGENLLALHTYYQGLINRVWVSGDDRHGLILDLELNGKTVLRSDESFLWHEHTGFSALGKAGYDTNFLELYDSAAPEAGFEQPGFDDSSWTPAVYRENPDWILVPQPVKQLEFEKIKPRSLKKTAGGCIADFGSNYVGSVLLKARGARGQRIGLRYGQELNEDGSVRFELRANCRYEEGWLLSGGQDTLNQYDYKSFRYVELLLPEGCRIDQGEFLLLARHYPFSLKAACDSADPRHRAVWDLCVNSLRYGVQEVIQDCMEREKGQYLGDGCLSSLALGIVTGDFAIFEKLFRETIRSSFVTKTFITCAPGALMQEIADYPLYMPMSAMMYYHLTGNREFLEEIFPALRDMLRSYAVSYGQENGLIANLDKWCVVEWPAPFRDGYDVPDMRENTVCRTMHNAINALYIGAVKFFNKMAALLGEPEFTDAEKLVKAFHSAFYDAESGFFRDSVSSSHISMPGQAYAFLFNLCPDKRCQDNILALIREKQLSASMFFVSYAILAGLVRIGEVSLVKELMASQGAWLRMIREGATTTFEGWGKDLKWNTSLFHLTFTYGLQFLTDWGMEKIFEGI